MSQYNSQTTASSLITELSSSIRGKTILVTGVSPGSLGATLVTALASASPRLLILAGRNPTLTLQTTTDLFNLHPTVPTRILDLNLSSFQSVRTAATTVLSWNDVPVIDILINNAGIMAVEYGLSVDGVERQFATNHLGHFLLANLIMGKMLEAEAPRVVCVSSDGHRFGGVRFDDYNFDVSCQRPGCGVGWFLEGNADEKGRAARLITSGLLMGSLKRRIC